MWHKDILLETLEEQKKQSFLGLILAITGSVFLYIVLGFNEFIWVDIEPIPNDGIYPKLFYSAITFVTLGRWLFKKGFYKELYRVVSLVASYSTYKEVKLVIWFLLISIVFAIIHYIIVVLNAILSFGFNIFRFIVYLAPPLGIGVLLLILYYAWKQYTIRKQ